MDWGNNDLMSQQRRPTPARLRTILPGRNFQPLKFGNRSELQFDKTNIFCTRPAALRKKRQKNVFFSLKFNYA
jgi:hypothetical protein